MSDKDLSILDLDAMLDETLDNVENVPDFMNPPNGLYLLAIKEAKIEKYKDKDTKADRSRFRITHAVSATIQVEAGNLPVPDGTMFSETFTGTEDGIKYFKKAALAYLGLTPEEATGIKLGDLLATLPGQEYKAKLVNRITKDGDKTYENLRINVLREAA